MPYFIIITDAYNYILQRVFRATMVTIVILNVVNVLEMKCVTLIQAIAQEDVEGIGRNPNVTVRIFFLFYFQVTNYISLVTCLTYVLHLF